MAWSIGVLTRAFPCLRTDGTTIVLNQGLSAGLHAVRIRLQDRVQRLEVLIDKNTVTLPVGPCTAERCPPPSTGTRPRWPQAQTAFPPCIWSRSRPRHSAERHRSPVGRSTLYRPRGGRSPEHGYEQAADHSQQGDCQGDLAPVTGGAGRAAQREQELAHEHVCGNAPDEEDAPR